MELMGIDFGRYHQEPPAPQIEHYSDRSPDESVESSEEEVSYEIIHQELRSWCELRLALIAFFLLLQLREITTIPMEVTLVPLILLEFRIILTEALIFKHSGSPRDKLAKYSLIKALLYGTGNIASYGLIMLYFHSQSIDFLIVGLVPALTSCAVLFIPGRKLNNCQSHSGIVIFT